MEYNTTINLGIGSREGLHYLEWQKQELMKLLPDAPAVLEGLLCFIDHIQDTLIDNNEIPESVVRPYSNKSKGRFACNCDACRERRI